MLTLKFIVGGGKNVRSKYSDDLPKWVNAALRSISFENDNSAAETFDSQGTFKRQHDTGKDLIFFNVFPHVACSSAKDSSDGKDAKTEPVLDTRSPEYLCMAAEMETFKEIVQSKLPFWRQRKACLKKLQEMHEEFRAVEQKMCTGQPLSSLETAIFEINSAQDEEKIAYLQAEIKKLVDSGELIANERDDLLKTLESNMTEASNQGQTKKYENIKARYDALEKSKPIVGRLRLGDQIQKLHMKLFPIVALEDKGRSMSLTIADLTTISEKDDIEEKLRGLIRASRGWFERDEDFDERCVHEEKLAKKRYDATKGSSAKKGSGLGSKGRTAGTQAVRGKNMYATAGSWTSIGKQNSGGGTGRAPSVGVPRKAASFADAFGEDSD